MNFHPKQWHKSVSGSGGKSSGAGTAGGATEADDTLRSEAKARFMDVVSWGPIRGLVNDLKSVYLDGTPVQNNDGSYNFTCTIEERLGEDDQSPSTLMPTTDTEISVGSLVVKAIPVIETLSGDYDGFKVRIRIPSLKKQNSSGKIVAHKVRYKIEWSPSGAGTWQHITGSPYVLNGKNSSPYFVDYKFNPPSDGPWDIRVTRISDDDEDSSETSLVYFDALIGIVDQKFSYPYSAYYAWSVNAKQFGTSIPQRKYDVYGRIVRVPTNYDTETRTYTGFWDGTFKLDWTDDPAWIYLDLHNWLYGTNIDDEQINLGWLYTVSQYCSELVPDGKGGEEPRYSINVAIYNREEALQLLNKITSVFRGMTFWANGQLHVMQDRPKDVRYVVGPANTQSGIFNYRSTSNSSRANQIIVSYNDGDNEDYEDIEVVEDNESIIANGVKPLEVQAWGCRSQGQAHRHGEWLLYTLKHDTELVSYVAGVDHDVLLPGDIIAVADPLKSSTFMMSGRLRSIGGTGNRTITLDKEITINTPGDDFAIMLIDNEGVARHFDVVAPINGTNTVTLTADFVGDTEVGHNMWALYNKDIGRRLYTVVGIRPRGGRREITALLYNPSKFGYIERDLPLDAPPTNPFVTGQLQAPLFFAATPYASSRPGSMNRVDLLCTWTKPPDNRIIDFQLQYSEVSDNPDWRDVYFGEETGFAVEDLELTNTKAVRVRSRGIGKTVSEWATLTDITVTSRTTNPLTPGSINVQSENSGGALRVVWTYAGGVKPSDFLHVEIYRATSNDIGAASLIATSTGTQYLDTNLAFGTSYYYWIRIRVHTDNPTYEYSAFIGPATASVLSMPLFSILDNSITAAKLADDSVEARHMMDNAILGPAISPSAVTTEKIAASAIIASHLTLTDLSNMVTNGRFRVGSTGSLDAWTVGANGSSFVNVADVQRAFQLRSGDRESGLSNAVSVRPGEEFFAAVDVYNTNAQRAYIQLRWYNSNDVLISTTNATTSTNFTDVKNAWTRVYGRFVAPANAASVRVLLLIDKTAGLNPTTYAYWHDVELRKAANAELIVDGAIIADKLGANSVTATAIAALSIVAGDIQNNAITGPNIQSNTIAGGHIQGNTITGSHIQSSAISSGHIAAGAIVAGKISAGAINASTIIVDNLILTGHVVSGQITVSAADFRASQKTITSGTPTSAWEDIAEITFTADGGNILIMASGTIFARQANANAHSTNVEVAIRRGNGTILISRDELAYDDGLFEKTPYSLMYIESNSGSLTFKLSARVVANNPEGLYCTSTTGSGIAAWNLKR